MNPLDWFHTLSLFGKALAAAVVAVPLVILLLYASSILGARREAAEARVGQTMGEAAGKAGADAVGAQDAARTDAEANETLSRENENAIQNAPGAGVTLDPGLNRAGRLSSCRRPAYRNSAECLQLLGRPDAEGGRSPG